MIKVTAADVVRIAPEFKAQLQGDDAGSTIASVVVIAKNYVNEGVWGTEKGTTAVTLLTAHLLRELGYGSGGVNHNGMVTQERVGDLSRSYSQEFGQGTSVLDQLFMTTAYGRQYIMLRRTLPLTPIIC